MPVDTGKWSLPQTPALSNVHFLAMAVDQGVGAPVEPIETEA